MKYLFLVMAVLLTACSNGMSPEEIESRIIEANTAIDYYKISSLVKIETEGSANNILMEIDMDGEINRLDKKGYLVSDTKMIFLENDLSFVQETYLDDNVVYTNVMDEWVKMVVDGSWSEQDQAVQYTELIENGQISIRGIEEHDGKDYYVVDVVLDEDFLNKYISTSGQELSNLDFGNYDITFYVNPETFVIERNKGVLTVSEIIEEEKIIMNMDIDTRIYDIGVVNDVQIPEEVLSAEDYMI